MLNSPSKFPKRVASLLAFVVLPLGAVVGNESATFTTIATVHRAQEDSITVTLEPSESAEVEVFLARGGRLQYDWATDGEPVTFNFSSEATQAPSGRVETHRRGAGNSDLGGVVASYPGFRVWTWRNKTRSAVMLRLRLSGSFVELRKRK